MSNLVDLATVNCKASDELINLQCNGSHRTITFTFTSDWVTGWVTGWRGWGDGVTVWWVNRWRGDGVKGWRVTGGGWRVTGDGVTGDGWRGDGVVNDGGDGLGDGSRGDAASLGYSVTSHPSLGPPVSAPPPRHRVTPTPAVVKSVTTGKSNFQMSSISIPQTKFNKKVNCSPLISELAGWYSAHQHMNTLTHQRINLSPPDTYVRSFPLTTHCTPLLSPIQARPVHYTLSITTSNSMFPSVSSFPRV
jgi:hypothetical protein